MRVGHFLAHFPAPGGTTTAVAGLSQALAARGHSVYVYGYGEPGATPATGIEIRLFPRPLIPVRPFENGLSSWLAENRDRLDLLVIHGVFGLFSPMIARAAREGGLAVVASPHDPYSAALFRSRRLRKALFWRTSEHPYLSTVDAIHVLAPSHRLHLARLGIPSHTFAIPNGVTASLLAEAGRLRSEAAPASRAFRLAYLGRWDVYNKGLDLLLGAIASDPVLRRVCRLTIMGRSTGSERRELRRLIARLRLGGAVSAIGYVADPWPAVREADALVLPSRFDGFGQVVLEALAFGTPVVASTEAGVSEMLGRDLGLLAARPDVPGLRDALRTAYDDRGALRIAARAALDHLREHLAWDVIAAAWEQAADGVKAAVGVV